MNDWEVTLMGAMAAILAPDCACGHPWVVHSPLVALVSPTAPACGRKMGWRRRRCLCRGYVSELAVKRELAEL